MSDEEKEAIRNFKSEYETCNYNSSDLIIELDDAKIILNLIETQQKEIEELKEKDNLYKKTRQLFENDLLGYIKGYEDGRNGSTGLAYKLGKEFADYTLSSQLNRYKKSYIEVRKELDNAISKDKIKAKIEEYNKMINATYEDLTHFADYRRDVCFEIKNVLNELLEE